MPLVAILDNLRVKIKRSRSLFLRVIFKLTNFIIIEYLKKVIGIDISKDSFVIRFGTLNNELQQKIGEAFTFSNDLKGFKIF